MSNTTTPVTQAFLFGAPLSRAAWLADKGQQAPPYDVTKPIKRWVDPAPASDPITYSAYDPAKKVIVQLTLAAAVASTVNLPGLYDYPKYVAAPTPARVVCGSQEVSGFNVDIICDKANAEVVAKEIGGSLYEEPIVSLPYQVDWRGETRRQWMILWQGKTLRAGALIAAKYAAGIGAPGKWDLSGPAPNWISEKAPEGAWSAMPEMAFPVPPLGPNQSLVETGFDSFGAAIQTVDVTPTDEQGGFTHADRAMLAYIKGGVQVIAGKLDLPV